MMIVACETEGCATKVFGGGFCVNCEDAKRKAASPANRPRALPIQALLRPIRNRRPAPAAR